jgi:hypothetical protein
VSLTVSAAVECRVRSRKSKSNSWRRKSHFDASLDPQTRLLPGPMGRGHHLLSNHRLPHSAFRLSAQADVGRVSSAFTDISLVSHGGLAVRCDPPDSRSAQRIEPGTIFVVQDTWQSRTIDGQTCVHSHQYASTTSALLCPVHISLSCETTSLD